MIIGGVYDKSESRRNLNYVNEENYLVVEAFAYEKHEYIYGRGLCSTSWLDKGMAVESDSYVNIIGNFTAPR